MKFTAFHTLLPYYCYSVFADKYTKLEMELDAVFFLSLTDVLSAFSSEHKLCFLKIYKIGYELLIPPCSVIFPKYFSMRKARRI